MKLLSTVTLAIALAAVPALCTAQPKAAEMRQGRDPSPRRVSGKVTHVDVQAKSFTIIAEAKSFTFGAAKLRSLPAVGDTVVVTYVVTPAGKMEAANLNMSKSNVN